MKARIKSNGKIVEVISRFMPRKRNAASRDWVCNLSDGTCIDESQLEYIKESIDGLDEAADEYAEKHGFRVPYDGSDNFYDDVDVKASKEAFIAGAKWQEKRNLRFVKQVLSGDFTVFEAGRKYEREQMMKDGLDAVKSGQSHKIEKTIAGVFVKYGMDKQKEIMMKGAVEKTVVQITRKRTPVVMLTLDANEYKDGDKVKVIICKKEG